MVNSAPADRVFSSEIPEITGRLQKNGHIRPQLNIFNLGEEAKEFQQNCMELITRILLEA
jgi:hypothetical protein